MRLPFVSDCRLFRPAGLAGSRLALFILTAAFLIGGAMTELAAGATEPLQITWPTRWHVFGPVADTDPIPDVKTLASVPAELPIGGKAIKAIVVEAKDGRIDLAKVLGAFKSRDTAYAFAELTLQQDQAFAMGVGADFWMQWWVDGKPLYDTLAGGNGFPPASVLDHSIELNLTKGTHVLAIRVLSGSGGFQFVSGGPAERRSAAMAPLATEPFPGKPIPHDPQEAFFGARIARTMTLLATSTPQRRNPVHIVFYGQSIVAQHYVDVAVLRDLRRRYPDAVITGTNLAIGGYTAPYLVRTATQDLYPAYPDLVIFHVYDGHDTGELERIVSNIRRYTTAEILMWTHHVDNWPERDALRLDGSAFRRYLAQKYNCELVEVRDVWIDYLDRYKLARADLLIDGIHLNEHGGILLGELVRRHFVFNSLFPGGWADTVRTYEVRRALEEKSDEVQFPGDLWKVADAGAVGEVPSAPLRLRFRGNRVDLVSVPTKAPPGSAKILIDGKSPSSFSGAYAATRCSVNPIGGRPALNRVTLGVNPVAEDWTLTAREFSPSGAQFKFTLKGSVTGPDGEGDSRQPFVSTSGRIHIAPRDFTLGGTPEAVKKSYGDKLEITWQVRLMGMDVWKPAPAVAGGRIDRYTVVQGIDNTEHTLEIAPIGDGPVAVGEIIVHRPPLP